jgi:hypothetical protein
VLIASFASITILCIPLSWNSCVVPFCPIGIFVLSSMVHHADLKSLSMISYCSEMLVSYVFSFCGVMNFITGGGFIVPGIVLVNVVSLTSLK